MRLRAEGDASALNTCALGSDPLLASLSLALSAFLLCVSLRSCPPAGRRFAIVAIAIDAGGNDAILGRRAVVVLSPFRVLFVLPAVIAAQRKPTELRVCFR